MIKDEILYIFSDSENTQEIEIIDSAGHIIIRQRFANELQILIKGWDKGVYVIRSEGEVFKVLL